MWQSEVQNAIKRSEIFKIMRWYKKRGNFSNPLIKHADKSYSESQEKVKILRHVLLEWWTSSGDIPFRLILENPASSREVKPEVMEVMA